MHRTERAVPSLRRRREGARIVIVPVRPEPDPKGLVRPYSAAST
ncbi:hypothetical protein PMNALOAF_1394 [Methylobacterium adhaesivum]|nr:hypothetical protein PMNALOAF_1394 [Methylobacterium adhaesivum]